MVKRKSKPGKRKALFALVMTGIARSDVKVNCRVVVLVRPASVAESVTRKLPSVVAVPEISPVTESMLKPGGRPVAVTRAAAVPPVVFTWKLKRLPVLPVALVTLMITGPAAGNDWPFRTRVALVVPVEFVALSPIWNVPSIVELPTIARMAGSNVKPEGKSLTSNEVAPLVSN